jgi:hypothetical protein
MNATAKTFLVAVLAVASAICSALMLANAADERAQPQQGVTQLERVVVVGKRLAPQAQQLAHIDQLPRVVIEGHAEIQHSDTLLAQASCDALLGC